LFAIGCQAYYRFMLEKLEQINCFSLASDVLSLQGQTVSGMDQMLLEKIKLCVGNTFYRNNQVCRK
jgi:hypothetical protein